MNANESIGDRHSRDPQLTKSELRGTEDVAKEELRRRIEHFMSAVTPCRIADQRIAAVQAAVLRNLKRSVSLRTASQIAVLEQHYFCTLFRRVAGKTFTEWCREQRVTRAIDLMMKPRLSIARIAQDVGYADYKGLERAFIKAFRATPRAVRTTLCQRPHSHERLTRHLPKSPSRLTSTRAGRRRMKTPSTRS